MQEPHDSGEATEKLTAGESTAWDAEDHADALWR